MKAWQVPELGEPSQVLTAVDMDIPEPGSGQVVVKTRATASNFPDVLMCRGKYQVRPDLPFTPGVELCGDVTAVGEGVDGLAVGDRVYGTSELPHGGFAEYAVLSAATCFPAPESLEDGQAASLFIGYQTAWFALHRRTQLKAGETLLVHAAAGGVGSAAVQIGKPQAPALSAWSAGRTKRRSPGSWGRTSWSTATPRTSWPW